MKTRRLGWLSAALGLALIVVLVDYVRYADARGETIRRLGSDAARTSLRDDLVGRRLFGPGAPVLPGADRDSVRVAPNDRGLLLWVVDPARCVDCLGELAATRELGRRGGVRTAVVLSGATARRAAGTAARGGTVVLDSSGTVLRSLTDGRLAGAAIYADPDGVVLAAEGFDDRTNCDWSFTASLGALLGYMDATRARRNRRALASSPANGSSPASGNSTDREDS